MQVGDIFTERFQVSAKVQDGFIATFNDRHPLHTDDQYAAERGFRARVMHGNILNGFLSYFIGECLPIREVMILSQEIKYNRPVYLDDILILHAKIVDIHDSVGVIVFGLKFRNETDGKVVATASMNIGTTTIQLGE